MRDLPRIGFLPDGRRLRMRHGPIDLIAAADGEPDEVQVALRQGADAFSSVLETLSAELPALRSPVSKAALLRCDIAKKMANAAQHFCGDRFATPMIAVAGAVADHVLSAMKDRRSLTRAYVNNGGDIALHLAADRTFTVGLCPDPITGKVTSSTKITARDRVGGVATSGWRGRSHSLGIADAVTVLARTAAEADAAATLLANLVDLPGHPAISRARACDLSPDSDLGERLVTTGVSLLPPEDTGRALKPAEDLALRWVRDGRIIAAHGVLQSRSFTTEKARLCLTS